MDDTTVDALGTITGGAILAREVERAHAPGHDHGRQCANYGATLTGPYCSDCGQHGHVHRTAAALLHDIAHGVFHFEGKIWRTLPLLAFRPGQLTRRYAGGQRASFVSPMALFLFSVFLMFAVTSSITAKWDFGGARMGDIRGDLGTEQARLRGRIARLEAKRDAAALPGAKVDEADRTEIAQDLAGAREQLVDIDRAAALLGASGTRTDGEMKVETGSSYLDAKIKKLRENPKLLVYKMKTAAYKYSWALIPISLPFIWVLFAFRRGVGMYDHAVFATYSLAFMMLFVVLLTLLSFAGVSSGALLTAAGIVPPVHMYKQLRHAYRLTRFGAGWRTFALLAATTITTTLFFTLLLYLGLEG